MRRRRLVAQRPSAQRSPPRRATWPQSLQRLRATGSERLHGRGFGRHARAAADPHQGLCTVRAGVAGRCTRAGSRVSTVREPHSDGGSRRHEPSVGSTAPTRSAAPGTAARSTDAAPAMPTRDGACHKAPGCRRWRERPAGRSSGARARECVSARRFARSTDTRTHARRLRATSSAALSRPSRPRRRARRRRRTGDRAIGRHRAAPRGSPRGEPRTTLPPHRTARNRTCRRLR